MCYLHIREILSPLLSFCLKSIYQLLKIRNMQPLSYKLNANSKKALEVSSLVIFVF